jgi:hypothetical protein
MTPKPINVPTPGVREIAHEMALKLARQRLAAFSDIERQCRNAGARYLAEKQVITVNFLGVAYHIGFPAEGGQTVPIRDKILILDYFTRAKGSPPTGRNITYQELHDGLNYYPTFAKRAIQPLVARFSETPERLFAAAADLGGRKADFGDVAIVIDAFPRVPLTFVLWRGDDEFPAEGGILFDANVSDYLSNDDIHALCENIAWKLVRACPPEPPAPVGRI